MAGSGTGLSMPSDIMKRLLPAPVGGGFALDGYWVWCGSVIRGEDGLYHMFAARWPGCRPMFYGYMVTSEVVRKIEASAMETLDEIERETGQMIYSHVLTSVGEQPF